MSISSVLREWGLSTVLSVLGLLLTLIGVFATAFQVSRKKSAEERLVELIQLRLRHEHKLRRLQFALDREAQELDRQYVMLYRQYVETALAALPLRDRERIEEALHQPSARGRDNYVRKLIRETSHLAEKDGLPA